MNPSFRTLIPTSRSYLAARFLAITVIFFLISLFSRAVFSFRAKGRPNLHIDRAFLVSNHFLYIDPGLIGQLVYPNGVSYSVLEETFRIPLLGGFIRLLGAFPLPKNASIHAIVGPVRHALELPNNYVHFFPEGRIYPGSQTVHRFKHGVFYLSILLDAPIIPVTSVMKPRGIFGRRIAWLPGRLEMHVGKPIYPDRFTDGTRSAGEHRDDRKNALQNAQNRPHHTDNTTGGKSVREAAADMAAYTRNIMQRTIDTNK